jgi:hypothetical protein
MSTTEPGSRCGTRNDAGAGLYDHCGLALAG